MQGIKYFFISTAMGLLHSICLGTVFRAELPKRPLRVLFHVNVFPSNTQLCVLNQIVGFAQAGHEVTILALAINNESVNMSHPDIIKHNLLQKTVTQLTKDLKKFDVILCEFAYLAPPLIELKKAGLLEGKLIIFYRGPSFNDKDLYHQRQEIFDAADLILPVSRDFKESLQELGCDPKKLKVLHSAVDCTQFLYKKRVRDQNQPIKLVTTARLIRKKGLEYGIEAVADLIKKYPEINYTIIGDGRLRDHLQKLINRLGLQHHVTLLGWQTPAQVRDILYDSHIFMLPSILLNGSKEGIPNALMEAMATGLPVIGTYHGGIPELIQDGVSGFLVPEQSVTMLVEKIDYLIRYPEVSAFMGISGREVVEAHFNKEKENKKLIRICLKQCCIGYQNTPSVYADTVQERVEQ